MYPVVNSQKVRMSYLSSRHQIVPDGEQLHHQGTYFGKHPEVSED